MRISYIAALAISLCSVCGAGGACAPKRDVSRWIAKNSGMLPEETKIYDLRAARMRVYDDFSPGSIAINESSTVIIEIDERTAGPIGVLALSGRELLDALALLWEKERSR